MTEYLLAIEPTTIDAETLDLALRRVVRDVGDIYADGCLTVHQLDVKTGERIAAFVVTPSTVKPVEPLPDSIAHG